MLLLSTLVVLRKPKKTHKPRGFYLGFLATFLSVVSLYSKIVDGEIKRINKYKKLRPCLREQFAFSQSLLRRWLQKYCGAGFCYLEVHIKQPNILGSVRVPLGLSNGPATRPVFAPKKKTT